MKGVWVPHDTRDQIFDYMWYWSERAEQPVGQLLNWLGLASSKYHTWKHRYSSQQEAFPVPLIQAQEIPFTAEPRHWYHQMEVDRASDPGQARLPYKTSTQC